MHMNEQTLQPIVFLVPQVNADSTEEPENFQDLLKTAVFFASTYQKPLVLFSSVHSMAAELDHSPQHA